MTEPTPIISEPTMAAKTTPEPDNKPDNKPSNEPDSEPDSDPDSNRSIGNRPDFNHEEALLSVDIDMRSEVWVPHADMLSAQAQFVWSQLGLPAAEVSLVLGDDDFIAALNADYRDKNGATNVLSFAAQDYAQPADAQTLAALPAPRLMGDIVLAYNVVLAEAGAQGKDTGDHMRHLLVHGLLHLLGYDHMDEADAQAMEALEIDILAAQGIDNPYAESEK